LAATTGEKNRYLALVGTEIKKSGPVSFAAKQKPHQPGIATALGLRAWDVLFIVTRTAFR
jgi:hypothetical protein